MIELTVANLLSKKPDYGAMKVVSKKILPKNKIYKFILRLRNNSLKKIIFFLYFFLFLDFNKTIKRLIKYINSL